MNTDKLGWKRRAGCLVFCVWCLAVGAAGQEPPKQTPEQEEQRARARQILEEARKIVVLLPSEQSRERAVLLQAISTAYADAGDIEAANRMLAAMGPGYRRLRASALNRVAIAQARSGDVTGALSAIDSAQGQEGKSMATTWVVIQLAKEGYWGPARQLADRIQDEKIRRMALGFLAQAQAAAGDASGARGTIEAIPDGAEKERTLQFIARAEEEIAAGKQVKIQDIGFPALVLGDVNALPEPDLFLLQLPSTGLLVGANKSEDPLVNQVRELVRTAVAAKEEDSGKALQTLREAAQLSAGIRTPPDRADQLFLVAIAQAELGGVQEARETAALLSGQKGGGSLRASVGPTAFRMIASAQAASGDVTGALAWAEGERDAVLKASGLVGAAEGIIRRLEVETWPKNVPRRINQRSE